jgi:hypothetical protein
MIVHLVRTSICKCGYPLMASYVKVGDAYQIDEKSTRQAQLRCGGCKGVLDVNVVFAAGKGDHRGAGWLPMDVFEASA